MKILSERVRDGEFNEMLTMDNVPLRQILADLIDLETARATLTGLGLMKSRILEMVDSCVVRDPTLQKLRIAIEEIDTSIGD